MTFNRENISPAFILLICTLLITSCESQDQSRLKYLERGKEYIDSENYDKARIEFKNALKIDPQSGETYNYLAMIENKTENYQKSIKYYNKAIELLPNYLPPHIHSVAEIIKIIENRKRHIIRHGIPVAAIIAVFAVKIARIGNVPLQREDICVFKWLKASAK